MGSDSARLADTWETTLTGAFEILLGRKLATFEAGASYAAYCGGNYLSETIPPARWLTTTALASSEPTELSGGPYMFDDDHEEVAWRFDLSESLFQFDDDLLDEDKSFSADFAAEVRSVGLLDGVPLVRGADLAPLLARHGVDLTHPDAERLAGRVTVTLKVATDGTLTDAMRAATFTHRGPEHLIPFNDEWVEGAGEKWEEVLAKVAHPALRDHLRMHCLDPFDARAVGAAYLETAEWPPGAYGAAEANATLIAGWDFAESQWGLAVVELNSILASRT